MTLWRPWVMTTLLIAVMEHAAAPVRAQRLEALACLLAGGATYTLLWSTLAAMTAIMTHLASISNAITAIMNAIIL